jgi:hypothetical protein
MRSIVFGSRGPGQKFKGGPRPQPSWVTHALPGDVTVVVETRLQRREDHSIRIAQVRASRSRIVQNRQHVDDVLDMTLLAGGSFIERGRRFHDDRTGKQRDAENDVGCVLAVSDCHLL